MTLISIYHHLETKIGASTAAFYENKTTTPKQRFQSNKNPIYYNREIILGNFDKIYYYSR